MSVMILSVHESLAMQFLRHLHAAPERVAFLSGHDRPSPQQIVVDRGLFVSDHDLVPGDRHVALSDAAMRDLMAWASGSAVLVEAHSHGEIGGPAALSWTDLDGLGEWVPHLSWRLPDLTYVALVYGAGTVDGLVWGSPEGPIPLTHLAVSGQREPIATTQRSLQRWHERFEHV